MPPDPTGGAGASSGGVGTPIVTICKLDDGSYMVYAGDEPDDDGTGGSDMSGDDASAMGAAGGAPAGGGMAA
jgi:hypothetical protein